MSIDIEKELRRMTSEFGLSEKEVSASWRSDVRNLWGKSVFKNSFYKQRSIKVKNENTRSMKRFPYVTKYQCKICEGYFSANETELDHLDDENTMISLIDSESFIKSIFFTSPDKLQILCKDKKRKVKGKSVLVSFGCHGIKTYASRYGVSFEKAKKHKEYINICKSKELIVDELKRNNIESIPKTLKCQKELLKEIMFGG